MKLVTERDSICILYISNIVDSVADPVFLWGTNSTRGRQPIIWQFFVKTYMKMKVIGPRGGRVHPEHPLNPPLVVVIMNLQSEYYTCFSRECLFNSKLSKPHFQKAGNLVSLCKEWAFECQLDGTLRVKCDIQQGRCHLLLSQLNV